MPNLCRELLNISGKRCRGAGDASEQAAGLRDVLLSLRALLFEVQLAEASAVGCLR